MFGSTAAPEMSVFHAEVDGNGTKPFRLAPSPRLRPPQAAGVPVEVVTVIGTDEVLVESCVDVAVIVAVSAVPGGVNVIAVPEATLLVALSVPPPDDGLIVRFTVFVNDPVP